MRCACSSVSFFESPPNSTSKYAGPGAESPGSRFHPLFSSHIQKAIYRSPSQAMGLNFSTSSAHSAAVDVAEPQHRPRCVPWATAPGKLASRIVTSVDSEPTRALRHVESIFRKQVVKVVTRNPALQPRKFFADHIAIPIHQRLSAGKSLRASPAAMIASSCSGGVGPTCMRVPS